MTKDDKQMEEIAIILDTEDSAYNLGREQGIETITEPIAGEYFSHKGGSYPTSGVKAFRKPGYLLADQKTYDIMGHGGRKSIEAEAALAFFPDPTLDDVASFTYDHAEEVKQEIESNGLQLLGFEVRRVLETDDGKYVTVQSQNVRDISSPENLMEQGFGFRLRGDYALFAIVTNTD